MIDDVSLKEHLDSRIDALRLYVDTLSQERRQAVADAMAASEKAINAAMAAAEKAITKAEAAQEKRNEAMNEFRGAMSDQQASFAQKGETDLRLAAIEKRLDTAAGKAIGISTVGAVLIAAATLIVGVVGMWLANS